MNEPTDHQREADLPELFKQAQGVLHRQSLVSGAAGWRAIRELHRRIDLGFTPPDKEWDDIPEDVKSDILHDVPQSAVMVTLQREADRRGIDVDYGIVESDGVFIPYEDAEVAMRELRNLIERTGGARGFEIPGNVDGTTSGMDPLALVYRRIDQLAYDHESLDKKAVLDIIEDVAERCGGEWRSDIDPLADETFRALDTFETALGE